MVKNGKGNFFNLEKLGLILKLKILGKIAVK